MGGRWMKLKLNFWNHLLSWADVVIAEGLDQLQTYLMPGVLKDYPELESFTKKVMAEPAIAAYIKGRRETPI